MEIGFRNSFINVHIPTKGKMVISKTLSNFTLKSSSLSLGSNVTNGSRIRVGYKRYEHFRKNIMFLVNLLGGSIRPGWRIDPILTESIPIFFRRGGSIRHGWRIGPILAEPIPSLFRSSGSIRPGWRIGPVEAELNSSPLSPVFKIQNISKLKGIKTKHHFH